MAAATRLLWLDLSIGSPRSLALGDTVDADGFWTFSQDAVFQGNVVVQGTMIVTQQEEVLISDNHLYLNYDYELNAPQTGGLVVNYDPTTTSDTVAAGGFTAGVVTTGPNPTVITAASATFAVGDLIQITGAANASNCGLFEVLSHVGTTLTIRGIGLTACIEDFTQNQFVTDSTVAGSIYKVNVSVIRSGTDGDWEVAKGNNSPSPSGITFTNLLYGTQPESLQLAYEGENTITTSVTYGNIEFLGTEDFTVGGSMDVSFDTTGGISFDADLASNFSVSGAGIDLSLQSSAGRVVVEGGEAAADAVYINASNAAGGVTIDAGTGGITASGGGTILIDNTDDINGYTVLRLSAAPYVAGWEGSLIIQMDGGLDADVLTSYWGDGSVYIGDAAYAPGLASVTISPTPGTGTGEVYIGPSGSVTATPGVAFDIVTKEITFITSDTGQAHLYLNPDGHIDAGASSHILIATDGTDGPGSVKVNAVLGMQVNPGSTFHLKGTATLFEYTNDYPLLNYGYATVAGKAAGFAVNYLPTVQTVAIGAAGIPSTSTISTATVGTTLNDTNSLPQAIITVADTTGFPASGTFYLVNAAGAIQAIAYTGTTPTTFTGCSGGTGTMAVGGAVSVSNTTLFGVGDFIMVTTASANHYRYGNLGVFQVSARANLTITITASPEPFVQGLLETNATMTGTIRTVSLSVIRAGTDGAWEVGQGSKATLTFTDLSTATSTTLQIAYVNGNTITTSAGEGNFAVSGTETISLSSSKVDAGAITLNASAGGIQIDAALQARLSSSQVGAGDAVRIVASDANGGIDIDAGATGGTIAMNAGGTVSLGSSKAAADAISLTASNAVGGIDINVGTNAVDISQSGADTSPVLKLSTLGTGADAASIFVGSSNPNTRVTAPIGSLFLDGTNGIAYINTDGATAWSALAAGVTTLQQAYVAGNTITVTSGEGPLAITLSTDDFTISGNNDVAIGTGALTAVATFGVRAAGAVTLDSTGAGVSIDGAGASNFTTTTGGLLLSAGAGDVVLTATTNSVQINAAEAVSDAVDINATNGGVDVDAALSISLTSSQASATAIVLNASTGGVDINSSGNDVTIDGADGAGVSIDGTGDSNFTVTTADASTHTLTISATNSGAGEGLVHVTADLVEIDGTGGVQIDSDTGNIDIGGEGDDGQINIGTATSAGRAITIGNTTGTTGVTVNAASGGIDITSTGNIAITMPASSAAGMVIDDGTTTFLTFDSTDNQVELGAFLDTGTSVGLGRSYANNTGSQIDVGRLVCTDTNSTLQVKYAVGKAGGNLTSRITGVAMANTGTGTSGKINTNHGVVVPVNFSVAVATSDQGKIAYLGASGQAVLDISTYTSGDYIVEVGIVQGANAGAGTNASVLFCPRFVSYIP